MSDHWSSPNGCHEDCPACAEEQEREARIQAAVREAWNKRAGTAVISEHMLHVVAHEAVGTLPVEEQGNTAMASALAEANDLMQIQLGKPPSIKDRSLVGNVGAIVRHLEAEGITSDHLDQAVHDAMSERASGINNDGLEAQVTFLLRGSDNSWKPGDIIHAARRAKRDEADDPIDADAEADACRDAAEGGEE